MTYSAKITKISQQITEEISREMGSRKSQIIEEALLQYKRSYRLNKLNAEFENMKKITANNSLFMKLKYFIYLKLTFAI